MREEKTSDATPSAMSRRKVLMAGAGLAAAPLLSLADREQNCLKGTTFTYASPDKVLGGMTYGGYSERIVMAEHFAIRMPPGANVADMTSYSRLEKSLRKPAASRSDAATAGNLPSV